MTFLCCSKRDKMEKDGEKGFSESLTGNTDIQRKCKEGWTKSNHVIFGLGILVIVMLSCLIGVMCTLILCMKRTQEMTETQPQKSVPCDEDWIWYRGKCYYFSDTSDTWDNSRRFCASQNSSLVIVDNETELKFLLKFKGTDNHWIGLRWFPANKDWIWINGESHNSDLFTVQRSSADAEEYAYLNDGDIKSHVGHFENKWICSKN